MIVKFLKYTVVFSIGLCVQQVSAYIYSFSNHSNEPIKVRVQLAGVNEPWVEVLIPAKEMRDFPWTGLGHSRKSLDIWKVGFCLQNIQMAVPLKKRIKALTPDGEDLGFLDKIVKDASGNVQFGPWAAVNIKWVQNEGVNAMIKASETFADGLQDIATSIAQAVATSQSELAE